MSLVNDALKRAKEAQQQAAPPPPSQMQFRPVEPGQHSRQGLGLVVPVTLTVLALLALVLPWQWAKGNRMTEPREVRAVTRTAVQTTVTPQPVSPPAAATTPAPVSEPSPPPQTESHSTPATGIVDTLAAIDAATSANPAVAKEPENEATTSVATAPAPQPKPAPLRLQAIVFNPKRPSALISGKTLFLGDKLGDARVVAIDRESATLVGGGRTNVLSLPE
jgi:MSHA biogenesis protein MshK